MDKLLKKHKNLGNSKVVSTYDIRNCITILRNYEIFINK